MRSLVVLAAVVCGIAVAIQAQFTGTMQREVGTMESTFITYFSGGLMIALVAFAARGGNLAAARGLPWLRARRGLSPSASACGVSSLSPCIMRRARIYAIRKQFTRALARAAEAGC